MRIGKIVRIWEVEPVEAPERAVPEPSEPQPAAPEPVKEPAERAKAASPR